MRKWIALGLILVGAYVAASSVTGWINSAGRSPTGEINRAGDIDPMELRVGDCYDHALATAASIETALARPCAEPHAFEVFYAGTLPAGDYPPAPVIEEFVTANCLPAFTTYVGASYDDSALEMTWVYPGEDRWRDGRTVQCAVYDPQESRLVGSLKGAAR